MTKDLKKRQKETDYLVWREEMETLSRVVPRYLEELKDNNPDLKLSVYQQNIYDKKKALRDKQPDRPAQ
ncbi:MAG: hypothetical protein AAFO69_04930 [Bacteroidota bacterium]